VDEGPRLPLAPVPRVDSDGVVLRKLSEPVPNDEPLPYDEPAPLVDGEALVPLVDSRTYRCASSVPRDTASRALSYISRPRSATSPTASDTRRSLSDAALAMFPACSEGCPPSSCPDFRANTMPSPAPRTVPVRSPI